MKIMVKSFFTGWHEVSKEQAQNYVKHLWQGMTAIAEPQKVAYIERNKLQGITVKELFAEV